MLDDRVRHTETPATTAMGTCLSVFLQIPVWGRLWRFNHGCTIFEIYQNTTRGRKGRGGESGSDLYRDYREGISFLSSGFLERAILYTGHGKTHYQRILVIVGLPMDRNKCL